MQYCEVVVPVSQLVLPVGVMGLTVNGKTPTPEPGSIVRSAVIQFKWHQENTSYDLFKQRQWHIKHKNTVSNESLECTIFFFFSSFGGGLLEVASQVESHSNS